MTRSMLIVVVALAAYTTLNVAGSIAVALTWRFRLASGHNAVPTIRARRLLWWRGMPTIAAIVLAFGVVTPSTL